MLAGRLAREPLGSSSTVLDLCTGSGLVAVRAALSGAQVVAADVSWRALISTRLNARLNGVRVRTRRGDLFAAVPGERFDLIVTNPPYLPSREEPPARGLARAWEAGPSGRLFIDRICAQAPEHLNPGGVLLLLHSSLCGEQASVESLRERGLETSVVLRNRGPLGELVSARSGWLRQQGLLGAEDHEEVIVIRACRSPVADVSGRPMISQV